MAEFIAIVAVIFIAIIAITCAITFFWQIGPWSAMGYAAFMVAIFLVFWASGLWQNASRHSWGTLTPIFILMIGGGGALVLLGRFCWSYYRNRKNNNVDSKKDNSF